MAKISYKEKKTRDVVQSALQWSLDLAIPNPDVASCITVTLS